MRIGLRSYLILFLWLSPLIACRTIQKTESELGAAKLKMSNDCGPARSFYFRWGKPEVHEQWLEDSAWKASTGQALKEWSAVPLASELMQAIFARVKDETEAVAGSGIYLSSLPFDTRYYGEHLLIFRIRDLVSKQGVPCPRLSSDDLKALTKDRPIEALPLIAAYDHRQKMGSRGKAPWFIVYRTPRPEENIELMFGPPSQPAVDELWREITEGRTRAEILARLADDLFNLRLVSISCNKKSQNPGEQFVAALYCEKTMAYLKAGEGGPKLSKDEQTSFDDIKKVLILKFPFDYERNVWLEKWPKS